PDRSSEDDAGQARDKVGAALGVSGKTVEKAARVAEVIRREEEKGHAKKADRLKEVLNTRGVGPAFKEAVGGKPRPSTNGKASEELSPLVRQLTESLPAFRELRRAIRRAEASLDCPGIG